MSFDYHQYGSDTLTPEQRDIMARAADDPWWIDNGIDCDLLCTALRHIDRLEKENKELRLLVDEVMI